MNFKHALSQIVVQAKCSNDIMKIEVLGVKLVNMATKADFTFPTDVTASTATLAQGQWSNLSGDKDHSKAYMVKGTTPVKLTSEAQSIMFNANSFMLIPQQLTKWKETSAADDNTKGAYLAVLCRVSSLNGTEETLLYPEPTADADKDGKYAFTAVGIDTNWEPGKKYTYTLDFCNGVDGGCGQIAPDLGLPDSSADATNIDTNPVNGQSAGYTILGAIKLSATVEGWTASSADVNM